MFGRIKRREGSSLIFYFKKSFLVRDEEGRPALVPQWGLGYKRWAALRIFFYLDSVVEIRSPCPSLIYIYNCKRGSSDGGTKTRDLSYRVI